MLATSKLSDPVFDVILHTDLTSCCFAGRSKMAGYLSLIRMLRCGGWTGRLLKWRQGNSVAAA